MHRWKPAFILTTGDNNYFRGDALTIDHNIGQYYHDFIHPYQGRYGAGADTNRFFPALGNHDLVVASGAAHFAYFTLPGNERYYDFVWGSVHIFVLNSDPSEPDGTTAGSAQAAWLKERMAASGAPWQIVCFHHPAYTSAAHGPSPWMQWPFKEWGADAVLSGHDHVYERLEIDGLPYFVNGLGGAHKYKFRERQPGSKERYRLRHGAMRVTAAPQELRLEFVNVAGRVIDRLVLTRQP